MKPGRRVGYGSIVLIGLLNIAAAAPEVFDEGRLEREILITGCRDAVQIEVARNGDVYYIERDGALKLFRPEERSARTVGVIPVRIPAGEAKLTGFALAPGFERNGWIYFYYSPKTEKSQMRLSRFTVRSGSLDLSSERITLEWPVQGFGHVGGGMQFDPSGNLWLAVGDGHGAEPLETAANSQDFRGKVLRIRPNDNASYAIPSGNLFVDPREGRPEIYIMGGRNLIRLFFDAPTQALYFSEVGPNTPGDVGDGGYDEINRAVTPGNHGWPLFTGPNVPMIPRATAEHRSDPRYFPERPINDNPGNTGLRELPPARPPLIWYPSENSREFPELGNGGRSACVGFVYRFDPQLESSIKLPAAFDARLFIYDWCRNWIKTVALDRTGQVVSIQAFLGSALLRRPIDLKLGPDGSIYIVEYGEKWSGNTDSQISRVIYRRGNRPPRAAAHASVAAGLEPLRVDFSGKNSSDPDGDPLSFHWNFGDGTKGMEGHDAHWTYARRGVYYASLTVTDPSGLSHTAPTRIVVGNTPPRVRIRKPARGSFFRWGDQFPYEITVDDAEDESTSEGTIAPESLQIRWSYTERPAAASATDAEIGLDGAGATIRQHGCLSCHTLTWASVGPGFLHVAEKYRRDPNAAAFLTSKVRDGGSGNWGIIPMAPHPQLSTSQIAEVVEYILALRAHDSSQRLNGLRGVVATSAKRLGTGGGVYVLAASYTDGGSPGALPLTTEARLILHAHRTRAALFDQSFKATVMEVSGLAGSEGGTLRPRRICVQLSAGGHISFNEVDLTGIREVRCDVSASEGQGGVLELRVGSPTGTLIGSAEIPITGAWDKWTTVTLTLRDHAGTDELFAVAPNDTSVIPRRYNLDALEFVP